MRVKKRKKYPKRKPSPEGTAIRALQDDDMRRIEVAMKRSVARMGGYFCSIDADDMLQQLYIDVCHRMDLMGILVSDATGGLLFWNVRNAIISILRKQVDGWDQSARKNYLAHALCLDEGANEFSGDSRRKPMGSFGDETAGLVVWDVPKLSNGYLTEERRTGKPPGADVETDDLHELFVARIMQGIDKGTMNEHAIEIYLRKAKTGAPLTEIAAELGISAAWCRAIYNKKVLPSLEAAYSSQANR